MGTILTQELEVCKAMLKNKKGAGDPLTRGWKKTKGR